jgi:hypothetical protein
MRLIVASFDAVFGRFFLHVLGVDPPRCTTLNWTENVKVGSVTNNGPASPPLL